MEADLKAGGKKVVSLAEQKEDSDSQEKAYMMKGLNTLFQGMGIAAVPTNN